MKKARYVGLIIFVVLISLLVFYFGMRWYVHESEVNAKLWAIQTATEEIAESIRDESIPYRNHLNETLINSLLNRFVSSDHNAYLSLAAGKNIRLLVVGDSISAQDWTAGIETEIKYHFGSSCNITNLSMGGNTSYAGYVRTRMQEEDPYDLALICFGQNDEPEHFEIYYEALIRSLIYNNPDIQMIALLESSQRTYTAKMRSILELADYYDIAVADVIEAYSASNFSYESLSPDGIHPGEIGKKIYLDTVMQVIFTQVERNVSECLFNSLEGTQIPQNSDQFNEDSIDKICYPEALKLENCEYWNAVQFSRMDKMRYVISVPAKSGLLGIYCARIPGDNSITISCGNDFICQYKEYFNHSFTQEIIVLFDEELHEIEGDLIVSFGSEQQADSFQALIISNS